MKIQEDFSKIAMDFEPLPADSYKVRIAEIEEGETQENKLPKLNFKLEVTEGEYEGRIIFDSVVLKQKDGAVNKIGLGRVRAYTAATLGDEAAAGGEIDTDELKGNTCEVVVTQRKWEADGKSGVQNEVKKVLPLG